MLWKILELVNRWQCIKNWEKEENLRNIISTVFILRRYSISFELLSYLALNEKLSKYESDNGNKAFEA